MSGNVKGITDANGELVASYEYDEWGKLLALTPAEDGNEEQIAVATKNPLRYRGYYYDNETGLYYLQSRYYSPDLCRFISPDDFEYINNSSTLYLNAYAYCYNNAVSLSDAEGTTPQLAMNVADISAFVKHIGAKAKETAKESLEKAKALLNKTVEKLKEMWAKLEEKRSQAIKDLKYFVENPDVVISQKLSKLLHKEVKVRFRVLEYIRATLHKKRASKYYMFDNILGDKNCHPRENVDDKSDSTSKAKAKAKSNFAESEKTENWFEALMKALVIAFEIDTITRVFESIVQMIKPSFDLNRWFNSLSQRSKENFENFNIALAALFNKFFTTCKGYFDFSKIADILENKAYSKIGSYIFENFTEFGGDFFSIMKSFGDILVGYDSKKYNGLQGFVIFAFNMALLAMSAYIPTSMHMRFAIMSAISNFLIEYEIDYENGHYWG